MPNDKSDLLHDLEDLNLAASRVVRHIERRTRDAVREAEALGEGLLAALVEYADSQTASDEHHEKWRGKPYEGDSEESIQQRLEWSPICGRLYDARMRLLDIARVIRAETRRPQPSLPLEAPKTNGQLAPESRL